MVIATRVERQNYRGPLSRLYRMEGENNNENLFICGPPPPPSPGCARHFKSRWRQLDQAYDLDNQATVNSLINEARQVPFKTALLFSGFCDFFATYQLPVTAEERHSAWKNGVPLCNLLVILTGSIASRRFRPWQGCMICLDLTPSWLKLTSIVELVPLSNACKQP